MKHRFQVIFCRNVVIYFGAETKAKLWQRLSEKLAPGGFLYVGHSERILGQARRELANCGPTVYRRTAGAAG